MINPGIQTNYSMRIGQFMEKRKEFERKISIADFGMI